MKKKKKKSLKEKRLTKPKSPSISAHKIAIKLELEY